MKNIDIAKKIVAKHGKYESVDVTAVNEFDKDRTDHHIRFIELYGSSIAFVDSSEKAVKAQAVKHFETMLDEETLVLSSEILDEL